MDASGALGDTIVFLDHFRSLPDPRQRGKVIYPLDEVLLLCLLAVLAGAESFVEIALDTGAARVGRFPASQKLFLYLNKIYDIRLLRGRERKSADNKLTRRPRWTTFRPNQRRSVSCECGPGGC